MHHTLILPVGIDLEEARERIHRWGAYGYHTDFLMTLDMATWFVYRHVWPEDLTRAVEADMTDNDDFGIYRAGMRQARRELRVVVDDHDMFNEETKITILCAHAPWMYVQLQGPSHTSIHEVRRHMAYVLHEDFSMLFLSSMTTPLSSVTSIYMCQESSCCALLSENQEVFFQIDWSALCPDDPYQPRHYDPEAPEIAGNEVENMRGGVRSSRAQRSGNPRTAMLFFAQDRVAREMPQMPRGTANLLLRAEARTVSAVLNARSSAQLEQVMQAALRRADLQQEAQQQADSQAPQAENLQPVVAQLTMTAQILAHQVQHLSSELAVTSAQPTKEQYAQMLVNLTTSTAVHLQGLQDLTRRIHGLEERIQAWEQNYLPEILSRLPHNAPQTPDDYSQTEAQQETPTPPQRQEQDQQDSTQERDEEVQIIDSDEQERPTPEQPVPPQPEEALMTPQNDGQPTILDLLALRSVAAQRGGRALNPFRSSH